MAAGTWSGAHAQTTAQAPAQAAGTAGVPIDLELNKLESLPGTAQGAAAAAGAASASPAPGCRVYMIVTNPDPDPITQLRLDLVLFGTDGVVSRRIAFDLAPLAAKKTGVRLFDLPDQPCSGIGRVLVNDVISCDPAASRQTPAPTSAEAANQAFLARLHLSSRTKAEFAK